MVLGVRFWGTVLGTIYALKPMAVFDGLLEVSSIPLNSIRVWDKLHKLPPRLHTKNVGRNIGGTFGKFMHVDKGIVPMYKLQSRALRSQATAVTAQCPLNSNSVAAQPSTIDHHKELESPS